MNDKLNQKISQFLDNDLDTDEALDLLQKMRSDAELTSKLLRYEAIGQALKTDHFLSLKPDFSKQLSAQLANEPTVLVPRNKPIVKIKQPSYRWLALAASVAVLSVIAVRSLPLLESSPKSTLQTLQVAQQQQTPKALPAPVASAKPPESEQPLNARINDYLQAHNGSVYANNPNLQSMARVTTYNPK